LLNTKTYFVLKEVEKMQQNDTRILKSFNYRLRVTVEGICEETTKPIHKMVDVKYYAGDQEPDAGKIVKKALQIARGMN
jgi:hypothetical protein